MRNARNAVPLVPLFVSGLVGLLWLGGCSGRSDAPSAGPSAHAKTGPVTAPSSDLDLVAAVPTGTGTAPVGLRFAVQELPVVGQSFHVRLQVSPTQDVDKLQVTFDTSPGLEIDDEAPFFYLGKTLVGESKDHVVALHASADGVFELHASVTTEAISGNGSSTFAIPVIVAAAATAPKP